MPAQSANNTVTDAQGKQQLEELCNRLKHVVQGGKLLVSVYGNQFAVPKLLT